MLVSFVGPFSWEGAVDAPSVYDVAESRESDVYLWTVRLQNGHLIYYVGETGVSFGAGLRQHYTLPSRRYVPRLFANGGKEITFLLCGCNMRTSFGCCGPELQRMVGYGLLG
jgi:hypothetical protein